MTPFGLHKKIRPVNRLDKDTSGLVVFAKNEYIQESLVLQMKSGNFKKEYIAICDGIFEKKRGTINFPIARKPGSIIERIVDASGDEAITHYNILNEKNNMSLIQCILQTGRTHQIRVHLSHIGHPILGDSLYGSNILYHDIPTPPRQLLHAYKIQFMHPVTHITLDFIAPLPDDFQMFDLIKNSTKHHT